MPDQPTDAGKDREAIQNAVRLAEANRQARIEQDGDEAIATIADALNSEMRECGLPECDPTIEDIKGAIRLLVDCLRAEIRGRT